MRAIRGLCGLCLLAALTGCGKSEPLIATAPFEEAVNAYLQKQNMAMKAHAFKELKVEGDRAVAKVSLGHAEGGTGIKVQWGFEFERVNATWRVTGHTQ